MDKIFYKIIAILGALAWLSPIIVPWIIDQFRKIKLTVVLHEQIEINYSTLGSLFNLTFAIVAKNKDALIEKIDIHLQHETNDTYYFKWKWYEEQFFQMNIPTLGSMPIKKFQNAILFNAIEDQLVEKKIIFYQPDFQKKYTELVYSVNETHSIIEKAGNDFSSIVNTKEYNALNDYIKNAFFWKIGKYKAKINVFISKRKRPFKFEVSFQLSNLDLKTLEKNIELCQLCFKNQFIEHSTETRINWMTAYLCRIDS